MYKVIFLPDTEEFVTTYDTLVEIHNYLELDDALEAGKIAFFSDVQDAYRKAEEMKLKDYDITTLEEFY